MRLLATFAALSLTASSIAQAPATFTDPANLRGERVKPRDGRELPVDQGSLGLQQLLRKLNTRASILNIVAHPDDEDGGMLTYYARGLGARVADISLTRGEGGQNAVTGDFEDALGLLRTQELLANDRYVGVDQMFGTEVDFGFSKTKTEAFAKWTHERVLYDVVRAIRLYRPLVLTSTWIGNPTDGHGQHQVSGQIAQEAFVAAGDPKVFPELTAEGILPWQPLRVYARVPMSSISDKGLFDYATGQFVPAEFTNYVTGKKSTTPPSADVLVHEGAQDPLLTRAAANSADLPHDASQDPDTPFSYVQFARIGLSLQRSQVGPGVRNAPKGTFDVAYHLFGNNTSTLTKASNQATFFDGIDTSVEGIATLITTKHEASEALRKRLAELAGDIQRADRAFQPQHDPSTAAPFLAGALQSIVSIENFTDGLDVSSSEKEQIEHELAVKETQLSEALALALGLHFTAEAKNANLNAGYTADAKATLSQDSDSHILYRRLMSANSNGQGIAEGGRDVQEGEEPHLAQGHPVTGACGLSPSLISVTRPYFTRDNIETPVYKLSDESLRNAPATPPALICLSEVEYNGARVQVATVATYNKQPVAFVPPASVSLKTHAQIFPEDRHTLRITANVEPFTAITVRPTLFVPEGWQVRDVTETKTGPNIYTSNEPIGTTAGLISATSTKHFPFVLKATATYGGNPFTEGFRAVGYGDLPGTNFYTPATTRIVPVDLKLPTRHHIAYLPGTGDSISEELASIGFIPAILSINDLTSGDLKDYDTIILGVRAYNAHPELHGAATKALLDYARNGGNVIVQYQTPEFTGDDAPFPLSLGTNEKVVDETAPVQLLTSTNALLTTPNRITSADFNGWNEERGHGFLSTWDDHYTALTETYDPGAPEEHVAPQLPQRGGLITVQLGKGRWTYCAFALYRQLPEANPGAFRLFMNLINP